MHLVRLALVPSPWSLLRSVFRLVLLHTGHCTSTRWTKTYRSGSPAVACWSVVFTSCLLFIVLSFPQRFAYAPPKAQGRGQRARTALTPAVKGRSYWHRWLRSLPSQNLNRVRSVPSLTGSFRVAHHRRQRWFSRLCRQLPLRGRAQRRIRTPFPTHHAPRLPCSVCPSPLAGRCPLTTEGGRIEASIDSIRNLNGVGPSCNKCPSTTEGGRIDASIPAICCWNGVGLPGGRSAAAGLGGNCFSNRASRASRLMARGFLSLVFQGPEGLPALGQGLEVQQA